MRLLAHDALTVARRILDGVRVADNLARAGHEAKSRALLSQLASEAASEIPVIDGVLKAQAEATEAFDFTQWTPAGRIPVRQKPAEHLNAANDHEIDPSSDTA